MSIRSADLRRRVLRVSPDTLVGYALKAIQAWPRPEEWLLLCPLAGGYAAIGVQELARRAAVDDRLLARRLDDLGLAASPSVDVEEELDAARGLLGATGYVVALRDGAPYGVLVRPSAQPIDAPALRLLAQAAEWRPTAGQKGPGDVLSPRRGTAAPPPELEPIHPRADRYVNADFADDRAPDSPLPRSTPLQPGQWYVFRLNVGEIEPSSIEETPAQLPAQLLSEDVEIVVALFSESFSIERERGALLVPAEGRAAVKAAASLPGGLDPDAPLARERLLFRVRAPNRDGLAELRVCMYCRGLLIQSRVVAAVVGAGQPLSDSGAMQRSALDFDLSPTIGAGHLRDIAPHKLSLMLNSNGDGTHAFRVFGQDGGAIFQSSATMLSSELSDLLRQSRNVMQQVAWGYIGDWDQKAAYRYDPPSAAQQNWRDDVIRLAVQGYRLYDNRIRALAGSSDGEDKLRELLRAPGMVQLASKASASDVVPIALFYDYDLDTQSREKLTICPQFEESLRSGRALVDEPCFQGSCPNREGHVTVVCPSGFWGFRHDIGMPWPAPGGPEMAKTIGYSGEPLIDVAYFQFPQLGGHLDQLGALGYQTQRQSEREPAIAMFKATNPQLVYFYCHGVLIKQTDQTALPALMIGSAAASSFFDTTSFRPYRIRWPEARPLVFVNGCYTTQLSPDQALNFVKTFVEYVEAAGVVGTEITVFEPLAQRFAESFLKAFRAGAPFGRAIRLARLQLLAECNPLGLVYQPFAYAGLKLVGPAS